MENPVTTIKSNLSVGKIVGFLVLAFVVFFLLDVAGLTPWILSPYRSIRAKFFPAASGS